MLWDDSSSSTLERWSSKNGVGEIRYGFSLANRDKGTGAVSDFPEDGRELSEPSVPSESKVLEKSSTQSEEARMGTLGRQDRERVEGIT